MFRSYQFSRRLVSICDLFNVPTESLFLQSGIVTLSVSGPVAMAT